MNKNTIRIIIISVLMMSMLFGCNQNNVAPSNAYEEFMTSFQQFSSHLYNGTMLIAKDGEILFHQAFGFADYENEIKMTTDHQFPIGSISKSMTAVSILQLQENGLLDVFDSIASTLEDFDEDITIHHLLTHTSGLQRDGMFLGRDPVSLEDNINFIKTKSLLFSAGEKFSYSNAGYNILASIVESKSNQTYNQYLNKNVFTPLNMTSTYGGSDADYNDNQAIGYRFEKGSPLKLNMYNLSSVIGSGNVYSTSRDMNIYIEALKTQKLLTQQSLSIMLTKHWDEEHFSYGYGWEIETEKEVTWYKHMGNIGNSGYVSLVQFSVDPDYTLIYLTNNDNTTALDVVEKSIEAILLNRPYVLFQESKETSLTQEEISNYVGTYLLDVGVSIRVKHENNKLYATSENDEFFELISIGNSKFHYKDLEWITLEFSNENEIQTITIQNIDNVFQGTKQ